MTTSVKLYCCYLFYNKKIELPEVLAEEYFETEEEKKEKFEKIRQQNEARNKRLDTILNKTSLNTKMQV